MESPMQVSTLMHQLKGAPLSVLIVLGYFNRTMGRDELAMMTSYSPPTVGKALDKLSFMGLAQQHMRFTGWMLTTKARQLPLLTGSREIEVDAEPTTESDAPAGILTGTARGKKLFYLGSSSSLTDFSPVVAVSEKLQTTDSEVKNLHLGTEGEAAVAALLATGMPATSRKGSGARDAVAAAIEGGWSEGEALDAVKGWLAYAAGAAGKGIQHVGFFAASKVRAMITAPAAQVAELSRDEQARRYVADAYARVVRH